MSPVLYTGPRSTVACSQIVRGTGVRSFDVSRYGGLLVAGGDDGVLDVYGTQSSQHRVSLEGHIGDITSCLFFPSGQVVLSAATDLRLRVWSASDGTNPVTLVGHTAAITDTAIVGNGKNVLSAGKDGTLRLWHCGSASVLYTFDLSKMAINAIDLVSGEESEEELPVDEFETAGKIVAVACEDGRALFVDLRSRETIAVFTSEVPVRAVAYAIADGLLFTGRSDGVVDVWTTDAPATPAYAFKRNNSPISALRLVQRTEAGPPLLCVGTEDGQLYLVALEMTGNKVAAAEVVEELVAFDVDPITQIRAAPSSTPGASRQSIWASGRTGKVYEF
ncbi:Proteasomal ATPase-associated factor 1 [Coemansia sp. S100]|nr:Proteasomal ATPase-associated factor 1 [Coemansia sp. S100]